MGKRRRNRRQAEGGEAEKPNPPTLRDQVEVYLFLAVEIVCILLFIDFLFTGFYVK